MMVYEDNDEDMHDASSSDTEEVEDEDEEYEEKSQPIFLPPLHPVPPAVVKRSHSEIAKQQQQYTHKKIFSASDSSLPVPPLPLINLQPQPIFSPQPENMDTSPYKPPLSDRKSNRPSQPLRNSTNTLKNTHQMRRQQTFSYLPPSHPAPPPPLHTQPDCPPDIIERNRAKRQQQIDQQASIDQDSFTDRPSYFTGSGKELVYRRPKTSRSETCPNPVIPQFNILPETRPVKEKRIDSLLQVVEDETGSKISVDTVQNLLCGTYSSQFDRFFIIDCRYEYEYQGGHIQNAINITPSECEEKLQRMFMEQNWNCRVAIVFHCEFSSKRGPTAWRCLRNMDRQRNIVNYPQLSYPHVYVMEGGYKDFWNRFPGYCRGGYIEMKDKRFCNDLQENIRRCKNKKTSRSFVQISNNENVSPLGGFPVQRLPIPLSQSTGGLSGSLHNLKKSKNLFDASS